MLHHVAQLAHVAGPAMHQQRPFGGGGELEARPPVAGRRQIQEVPRQGADVVASLAQGGRFSAAIRSRK
jgi:hypothetical protein